MKIISWNVNGLNAALKKGLMEFIEEEKADVYCFQEVKVTEKTLDSTFLSNPLIKDYKMYWNPAQKNGYSGTMVLSKISPKAVMYGLNDEDLDSEGRMITVEFDKFFLLNGYLPNAGYGLKRLDFKLRYNKALWNFLDELKKEKGVILCGDLNVAHDEIDLANPASNKKHAGFTQEERDAFSELLNRGYKDTFRHFTKEGGHYTYWSYRTKARERNVGWRLDYFVVNKEFFPYVKKSENLESIYGSDHCPIRLTLDLK
ncbi:MAG: exodeoxyribonuclease III [Promethearchaeota archaeon]